MVNLSHIRQINKETIEKMNRLIRDDIDNRNEEDLNSLDIDENVDQQPGDHEFQAK